MYHVCNRGSRKGEIFEREEDYFQFEELLACQSTRTLMRIIAYCLMRTHFHLVLWPRGDDDLPRFMQRLTGIHAQRWHRSRGSVGTGAVYQSRYRAKPVWETRHYYAVLRYVERNALAAHYVERAEAWPWGSATIRLDPPRCIALHPGPFPRPLNWQDVLNLE